MKTVQRAVGQHRLHALCPYFAMFPPAFVRDAVLAHTKRGDLVYDPFSGRGTTLLESLLLARQAIASDVNPVAYCISGAKAHVPQVRFITGELDRLEERYVRAANARFTKRGSHLPAFFRYAFHPVTLQQLLFLRKNLQWGTSAVHRFIAALILGHLHGEVNRSDYYLSNQMPHSISTKPGYSVRYWRKHHLIAPFRDCFSVLRNRLNFRLAMGSPEIQGRAALCDVRNAGTRFAAYSGHVKAIITSPPYLNVTRFEEDQWLRLWFLGGHPFPTYRRVSRDDRYSGKQEYWDFIRAGWQGVAPLMSKNGVLVCRIGAKGVCPSTLVNMFCSVVRDVWPKATLINTPTRSRMRFSQMSLLHPKAQGCRYELDFAFSLR